MQCVGILIYKRYRILIFFLSIFVPFSLGPRSSFVRLSLVIRLPIKNQSKNERENNEKTAK